MDKEEQIAHELDVTQDLKRDAEKQVAALVAAITYQGYCRLCKADLLEHGRGEKPSERHYSYCLLDSFYS